MADEISTLMRNSRDKLVLLRLRNSSSIQGILKDFDIHMNLTLDDTEDVTELKVIQKNLEKFYCVEIIFY